MYKIVEIIQLIEYNNHARVVTRATLNSKCRKFRDRVAVHLGPGGHSQSTLNTTL